MATITYKIDINIEDVIEKISDSHLIAEIIERELSTRPQPACNTEELIQALDESSMILRKDGRADLAFRLDELRKEL